MTDERVDRVIGALLRGGVIFSAAVVAAGAVVFVLRHGAEHPDYATFHGMPAELRKPALIVDGVLAGRGRALVQLGLMLLIATPVARVVFSVAAFALERDWVYVAMTVVVLAVLLYSLAGGNL
jgi:uncharacterized membrane protein